MENSILRASQGGILWKGGKIDIYLLLFWGVEVTVLKIISLARKQKYRQQAAKELQTQLSGEVS